MNVSEASLATNCTSDLSPDSYNLPLFGVTVILHLFALVANALVIIVYTKASGLTASQVLLRNLAIIDLAYAIITPLYVYRYVYPYFGRADQINFIASAYMAKYLTPIIHFTIIMSTWLVVSATVVRYIAACRIAISTKWSKPQRTRKITLLIAVVCGLWTVFDFTEKYFFPIVAQQCTGYFYFTEDHPLRSQLAYVYVIFGTWMLGNHVVPAGIIAFCNVKLIMVLRTLRGNDGLREGQVTKRKQRELILIIMGVTVSFVVFTMPIMIEQMLWRMKSSLAPIMQRIAHTCLLCNHIVNFVIYTCLNRQFSDLLKSCLKVQPKQDQCSSSSSRHTKLTEAKC